MLDILLEHDLNDIREAISALPTRESETEEHANRLTTLTITREPDTDSRHALAELAERIYAIVDHAYARKAIADVHTAIRANSAK